MLKNEVVNVRNARSCCITKRPQKQNKGKHRTQRVVIYYRFVGYIDLSEADFEDALLQQENHRVDTRQGVAVEYLPEKPKPEHRPAEAIA